MGLVSSGIESTGGFVVFVPLLCESCVGQQLAGRIDGLLGCCGDDGGTSRHIPRFRRIWRI